MSDNLKIDKWKEDLTPRRVMQNFFKLATPVDSPDPGELVQLDPLSSSELGHEATPIAGSSQSSQRSGILKRKLTTFEQQSQGNISKRSHIDETQISKEDSIFDKTEVPSQLDSPSNVVLPRPIVKNKKRASTTAYTQVIQSQQSQKSNEAEVTDFLDESSIPSGIGSPDVPISQRPGKSKGRDSTSAYTTSLGEKNVKETTVAASSSDSDSSNSDSTEIPSNLESPEKVFSQRPGVSKEKRRASSIGYKNVLDKPDSKRIQLEESSSSQKDSSAEIPSLLESPDQFHSQRPGISKEKKRAPSIGFKNILDKIQQYQLESSAATKNSNLEITSASDSESIPELIPSRRSEVAKEASVTDSRKSVEVDQLKTDVSSSKTKSFREESLAVQSPVNPPTRKSQSRMSDRQDNKKDSTSGISQSLAKVSTRRSNPISSKQIELEPSSSRRESSAIQRSSLAKRTSPSESIVDPPSVPLATQAVEETRIENPILSQPAPVENIDLEQYLSLSDNEDEKDTGNRDNIVEFTYHANKSVVQEPIRKSTNVDEEEVVSKKHADSGIQHATNEPIQSIRQDSELSVKRKQKSNLSATAILELDSPDAAFSPMFSSTQVLKTTMSVVDETMSVEKTRNATIAQQPQPLPSSKEKTVADSSVENLSSEIPSKLESPSEVKKYRRPRPGPASSKKRESMTGFLEAVQKTTRSSSPQPPKAIEPEIVQIEDSNSPIKPSTPEHRASTPLEEDVGKSLLKTPAPKAIVEERGTGSRRTLTPVVKELARSSRRTHVAKELRKSSLKTPTPIQLVESDKTTRSSSRLSYKSSESSSSSGTLPRPESVANVSEELEANTASVASVASAASATSTVTSVVSVASASVQTVRSSERSSSPVIVSPEEAIVLSSSSSSGTSANRSRKSLKFDNELNKDVSERIKTPTEEPLPDDEAEVEETPTTDIESEESEDEDEGGAPATPGFLNESNRSSTKSAKTGMSPTNRYPALKNSTVVAGGANSTVVAGGAPFVGAALSMSPIRPSVKDIPLAVPPSPSTPPPLARKSMRPVAQSPMFMSVMQKTIGKTVQEAELRQSGPSTPAVSNVTKGRTSPTPKNVSRSKGLSISNPGKGKSLVLPALDEMPESSDTEWEDLDDDPKVKPLPIKIAFEEIEDRSKDYVPLEQRLKADPVFQAKVRSERAKLAAEKAVKEAAVAKKKLAQTKSRAVVAVKKKKQEDNVTTVANNRANLRFFARSKLSKDALESIHDLVGEWLNFTLDQMESFCHDEGKRAMETWEDCMKMMKRQGIVKNYWDYSGLCHELLLNDESAKLLPSEFPPGHYDKKREAKRQSR